LDDKELTLLASEYGNAWFVLIYRETTEVAQASAREQQISQAP
jgi:hypothetical protein